MAKHLSKFREANDAVISLIVAIIAIAGIETIIYRNM